MQADNIVRNPRNDISPYNVCAVNVYATAERALCFGYGVN